MQETKEDQCQVHLEVIDLQKMSSDDIKYSGILGWHVWLVTECKNWDHKNFCPREAQNEHAD